MRYCICFGFAHGTPNSWMIRRHVYFRGPPHHRASTPHFFCLCHRGVPPMIPHTINNEMIHYEILQMFYLCTRDAQLIDDRTTRLFFAGRPIIEQHTILFLPLPPGRPASYAPYSLHIKRDHRPAITLQDPALGRLYNRNIAGY
jgi:hypothetical protein